MAAKKGYAAPFPAYEKDASFTDLAKLVRSDRPPLLLIGAGASVGSGYPTWNGLLKLLKETALKDRKRDWRVSLDDMTDAPWTAEVFASQFEKGELGRLIRKNFATKSKLGEPHLTLASMRFPHFLTTNYDPSIEEALDRANRRFRRIVWPGDGRRETQAEDLSSFLMGLSDRGGQCSVVYLHGRYDSHEDDIVLTESDYVARYISSDDARRKLMAIFMTHPVLFVGFSMNDPDLANIMREVTARLRTKTPCHFALMSYKNESDREAIRARMVGKFGVRPVFFSRTPLEEHGDPYQNLLVLLDALCGRNKIERESKLAESRFERNAIRHDPDDPNKGRFGGSAMANGRRLFVIKTGGSEKREVLDLKLIVEQIPDAAPLDGEVVFHCPSSEHLAQLAA